MPLRYLLGEFLGPDDLLVVSMLGTAWFELGTSELLWYLLAVRLGSLECQGPGAVQGRLPGGGAQLRQHNGAAC